MGCLAGLRQRKRRAVRAPGAGRRQAAPGGVRTVVTLAKRGPRPPLWAREKPLSYRSDNREFDNHVDNQAQRLGLSGWSPVENEPNFCLLRGQYGDSGEAVQDFLNLVSAVRIGPGAPAIFQISLHTGDFFQ